MTDSANIPIYKNLAWLNSVPRDEAEALLFDCSRSHGWAAAMSELRPYPTIERFFDLAEQAWFSLATDEREAAFIDDRRSASSDLPQPGRSGAVAARAGTAAARDKVFDDIAEAKRTYRNKFDFGFVLYDDNIADEEILAMCKARLRNTRTTEIRIAGEECLKILTNRLEKLLEAKFTAAAAKESK